MENNTTIKELNTLLATLQVFNQGIHTIHWQLTGAKFFEYHAVTNSLYEDITGDIDAVAERIKMLDGDPLLTFSEYVKETKVPEFESQGDWSKGSEFVTRALKVVINLLNKAVTSAKEDNDEGTISFLGSLLESYQKKVWMHKKYTKE